MNPTATSPAIDLQLDSYDYDLPDDQIAQYPLKNRARSRLLVLDRQTRQYHHTTFSQIGQFLPTNSLLVTNNTKVMPARLIGYKAHTGGKVEVFLVRQKANRLWEVLMKPGRRIRPKTQIVFGNSRCEESALLVARVVTKTATGSYIVRFEFEGDFYQCLNQVGQTPLPPYIKRPPTTGDIDRYQCVYAQKAGAVAAPTAGLHFTQDLLGKLQQDGIEIATLTLHVGLGTFQPVKVDNILDHQMHAEYFEFSEHTARQVNRAKQSDRKIVSVGTTSVRALETAVCDGQLYPQSGDTEIFIYPGFQFQMVDALITNFHLPKSTLLMLISALADRALIMDTYRQAIAEKYRFYSYGDAMLIL